MSYTPLQLAAPSSKQANSTTRWRRSMSILRMSPHDETALRWRIAVLLRMEDVVHWQAALDDFAHLSSLTPDDHLRRLAALDAIGAADTAMSAGQEMVAHFPDR